MGPDAIRETLSAEGISEPAIDLALTTLATASDVRNPLSFARYIAANDYSPTKAAMGCASCVSGWLRNPESDPSLDNPAHPIFFSDAKGRDFVRPCRNCRPQRGAA